MGNVDLLISVGIWVAGVGMSAVGIEMTINPPNQPRKIWLYRGSFIVLGIAFVGLSIWQFDRADKESKRAATEHQQEQVRSEGNIKYMQGQLDTQNKLLGMIATNSDPKQVASLLAGMNAQHSTLKKDTLAVCSEMEQWVKQRMKKTPLPEIATPTKPTTKEIEAQNTYWQQFNNDYYIRFGPRVLAIVQQFGAKGVDVKMIEQQTSYGYLPNNIIAQLRAFANRLDENGNLKD
jgi:hypothetical protein